MSSTAPVFRLGLIGWPVAHSLSPQIHQAALHACGLTGEYRLYPVDPNTPHPVLDELLSQIRTGAIHGLNVTVPHKELLTSRVDGLTQTARSIGAVNTLVLKDGHILGENTDAPGFLKHIQRIGLHINKPLTCVVLGAGGSARAIAYALGSAGHRVVIAARRAAQAQRLVDDLARAGDASHPLSCITLDARTILETIQPDLLVNTTPLGMHPHVDQSPWPANIPLPDDCLIYDLIYNPSETRLLAQARQAGLPAVNGLGMLVEQAALSFAIWTGMVPPLESLYQAAGVVISPALRRSLME